MKYAIKLTHIRTKKRLFLGDFSGNIVTFETKEQAESIINKKYFHKQINAKAVKFNQ